MKMHKIISIICSLALILSAIGVMPAFNAEAITDEGLVADSGFEVVDVIAELDPTNSLTEGWVLHSNSSITDSPENDGTKVVRLDNERGDHSYADVSTIVNQNNFAVVAVIGTNSNSTYADGLPGISINDLRIDGSDASSNKFGFTHKNRGDDRFPRAGKFYYALDSDYYPQKDVTFEEDGYTKITLTVYRVDGMYYYYANGEFIGEIKITGEQTGKVFVSIFDSFSFAYVHRATVYSFSEIEDVVPPENPDEPDDTIIGSLIENSGYNVGEKIEELDFSSASAGAVTEMNGWTFENASVAASPDNSAMTLKLENEWGSATGTKTIESENFVVVATFGSDSNNIKADGFPTVFVDALDADGNTVVRNGFGFGQANRDAVGKTPAPGKYYYLNNDSYPQPKSLTFDEDGYTLVNLVIYRYNGVYSFYGNGELIASFAVDTGNSVASEIQFYEGYSLAYLHYAAVYEIDSSIYDPDEPVEGLFADSGFVVGEKFESIDFAKMNRGAITESGNWKFENSKVVKAVEGNDNALQITNYYGGSKMYADIDRENFVAVAVLGTNDNDKEADGVPALAVLGLNADGEYENALSLGFAQKNRVGDSFPTNGTTMITEGYYHYPSKIGFDDDGYSLVTLTIYSYNGAFHCYLQGEYLGAYANTKGIKTDAVRRLAVTMAWANVYVHSIDVYDIMPIDFEVNSAALKTGEKVGLDITLTADNTEKGDFDLSNMEFGAVVTLKDGSTPEDTTVETENANIVKFSVENTATENKLSAFVEVSKENADKYVNIRPYVLENGIYHYCDAKIYSAAALATVAYNNGDAQTKAALAEYFSNSKLFKGGSTKKITFTAFADFHYMKNLETNIICRSNVSDLEAILKRGDDSGSAFVMQLGDLVKDAKVSKELFDTYLNYEKENGEIMPVYGIYGNHDLEQGNKMSYVNTTLTNDENTVWGTDSGKMETDSRIAYYYSDYDGFRFIYLDNNYSYNPTKEIWERNKDGSYSYPTGNTKGYSLGPVQFAWLEAVLEDAGKKDMTCVIATHAALHPKLAYNQGKSGDAPATVALFKNINNKYPGTVALALNGHSHTNELFEADGIVWMCVNNTFGNFGGFDSHTKITGIYGDLTVKKEMYDNDGNFIEVRDFPMKDLQFEDMTYFTEDPLSAVITLDSNGLIVIEGTESNWAYNINPTEEFINTFGYDVRNAYQPRVSSYTNYLYTEEAKPEYEAGDINGDNAVNAADLALLKKVIAGLTPLDSEEVKNPDVDGISGTPNAADLAALKKIIAGLI